MPLTNMDINFIASFREGTMLQLGVKDAEAPSIQQ